jgi:hypothetical protein
MTASSAHDFDFLHGQWQVTHRRLKERLCGSHAWETFDGQCRVWPVLGGAGNVDDNLLHLPAGSYRAATLRTHDASTGHWSIWWLDGRHPGRLDVPVVGGFDQGVGIFHADDVLDGRPIRVRFRWSHTGTPTPFWEQAFSADGGGSWEINWTMRFERTMPPADGAH